MYAAAFSIAALVPPRAAIAGELPVADVSVSVTVMPNAFRPSDTGIIELTMHNHGPDAAGADYPGSLGNLIAQRAFLFNDPTLRPPYRILPGVTGCDVMGELVGPNVNLQWGYIWSFDYPPIPAVESRTCRIPIQFSAAPFESFDTNWRISTNPEDPDLTNNTVAWRFVAASPSGTVAAIPAIDRWAVIATMLGSIALAARSLWQRFVHRY